MDCSDDQKESITLEKTELQKDYHQEESSSLEEIVEDEGCYDISSMLEVVLKEEEGPIIFNYNISENFQVEATKSPSEKEISSLNYNNCKDIDVIQKIEKKFHCWICDHCSKRSADLFRHVKEVHLKYRPYLCGICGYRTCRTHTLRVHMLTVHKEIKNKCHHFKHGSAKALEIAQKLNHGEPQNVCAYSNKTGNSQDCMMNINKLEKTFFCSYCHHKTKWLGSLRNHISAVHMKLKPYNCPICNFKSSVRHSIKRHIKAVHMKYKPHLCPLCPYKATRSDTLKIHMKRLHSEDGLKIENT
ncbi:transcriptional repressor CTCFL isoform X4 [Halyomorpha halys]|uniref:transcriptional repressor CTCFL isoform X4 n=1 Tax=Halyomorpha halys TaxID=286706 RepID=UPI0006D4E9B9|nr:transcriptional repressor CTCFL-like isoform X4 [Halyomorpha halys]